MSIPLFWSRENMLRTQVAQVESDQLDEDEGGEDGDQDKLVEVAQQLKLEADHQQAHG